MVVLGFILGGVLVLGGVYFGWWIRGVTNYQKEHRLPPTYGLFPSEPEETQYEDRDKPVPLMRG